MFRVPAFFRLCLVLALLLLGGTAAALPLPPSIDIVAAPAGVAVDLDGSLTVLVPLSNAGTAAATHLSLDEVELHHGRRVEPVHLPLALADLQGDATDQVALRFHLHGPVQTSYVLALEGRYRKVEEDEHERACRERHEHEHEYEHERGRGQDEHEDGCEHGETGHWKLRVVLKPAPTGPVTGTSGSATGLTHQTQGPYPVIPQSGQGEADQDAPSQTPPGIPHIAFTPTAQHHRAADPQLGSLPGVTPDGGVGFVVNTGRGTGLPFPMDPNAAAPGGTQQLALASGNTFLQVSTDGGQTFPTTITNYSTVFGDSPDGGYCCDQVLLYIPSIDRVVWLVQSNQAAAGASRERVAWAKPADIVANFNTAWTWFDLTPGFIGQGANDFLDYPDLAVSNGFLYASFDDITAKGLIVTRISFADLQKPGGQQVTWSFTDPSQGNTSYGSHLLQNAASTMYWGGHPQTNQLQICQWADASNQYSCTNKTHNTYVNTGSSYASEAPDGQYWFAPQFKYDRIMSSVRRPNGELWFAWNAGRDSTFPHPYAAILKVHEDTLDPFDEFEIWNPDHSYAYPALGVNTATGEVAVSLMWGGGGKYFQNHAVGFLGDFVVWITTGSTVTMTSGTPGNTCQDASFAGNPANRCTRSGDYLGVRRVGTSSGLFATAGYETLLGDSTKAVDCLAAGQTCSENLRYIVFGRPGDTNGGQSIPPPVIK